MLVALEVPEAWWVQRDRKESLEPTESQEKMALKACRENTEMTGSLVFLVKLARVVKLEFLDFLEIREASGQRGSGVFEVRVDLQEKEDSTEGWDYQDHEATQDPKDNQVIQGNKAFQGFWELSDQGGLQVILGQRASGDHEGHRAQ